MSEPSEGAAKKRGAESPCASPPRKAACLQSSPARQSLENGRACESTEDKTAVSVPTELAQGTASGKGSDWAAMVAAEALASLTQGGEDQTERLGSPEGDQQPRAAAADSSTSSPEGPILGSSERPVREQVEEEEDEEDDDEAVDNLLSATSSTNSPSSASQDSHGDAECAIVSVQMAPEVRQSVALLAQVQQRLESLERKAARMHQRLDLKFNQQRRPHLHQRSSIIQAIPGFWVTALLNHPQLSAQIDEYDEDALSYMTNLELDYFKSDKLGYRIAFHFRRNSYFQNNVVVKEFHRGSGGSISSFSNPIYWHRGQNLTTQNTQAKDPESQKIYPSFFCWFTDHTNPSRDEIAQILKDDLYRNPLRYYLTPLWELRQNGSGHREPNNCGTNECVVISDSDEEEGGAEEPRQGKEAEAEEQFSGESSDVDEEVVIDSSGESQDGEPGEEGFSDGEKDDEELDVEELDDSKESASHELQDEPEAEEEEDIEVGRENDG